MSECLYGYVNIEKQVVYSRDNNTFYDSLFDPIQNIICDSSCDSVRFDILHSIRRPVRNFTENTIDNINEHEYRKRNI